MRDPRTGAWQALATLKTSAGRVATITALTLDATRTTLYVAGTFTSITKGSRRVAAVGLAQLNLKTGLWSKVGKGLTGKGITVRTLSLDAESGNLLVAGRFAGSPGVVSANVAVWSPVRKRWLALG